MYTGSVKGAMGRGLRREILAYGTSLTVLQGLESRHHLISLRQSRGRAASVPAISAELRRVQNKDLLDSRFESMLPDLLESLPQLTSMPFSNKTDLVQNVISQVYRGESDEMTMEQEYFQRYRDHLKRSMIKTPRSKDYDIRFDHVRNPLRRWVLRFACTACPKRQS